LSGKNALAYTKIRKLQTKNVYIIVPWSEAKCCSTGVGFSHNMLKRLAEDKDSSLFYPAINDEEIKDL
jgi:hypothetical protein